jgi:hypothetical protein
MSNGRKAKVYCNLCGSRIRVGFANQWKHLVKKHPADFLSKIAPLVVNPELAKQKGRELAEAALRALNPRCMS